MGQMELLDTNGDPFGVQRVSDRGRIIVSAKPHLHDVVAGLCTGTQIHIFGRNASIGGGVTETIWEGPTALYVNPAAGGIRMQIVSTDAKDDAAGVGVRTVELHYLDADGAEQDETLTMDGLTPALTTATDIWRVQDMHTLTAGTELDAAGDITLEAVGGAVTYATMLAGKNTIRQARWTVPASKTLYISEWAAWPGAIVAFDFSLVSTSTHDGELVDVYLERSGFPTLLDSGQSEFGGIPLKIPALADVEVRGTAAGAGTASSVQIHGWYT